jgi:murein DD-endopeptidase MepM/ murein hydrolase activator NlpD
LLEIALAHCNYMSSAGGYALRVMVERIAAGTGRPSHRVRWLLLFGLALALVWSVAPERPRIPVAGAARSDWNPATFWHEPWGRSGVHKGIDIFARKGTAVIAPTYGIVVFTGNIALGGKVAFLLGPGWRLHYFAHLQDMEVGTGRPLAAGARLGTVGDSGNAAGRPPHLHYSVLSLLPRPWRADEATQGWKKMFYLDPSDYLAGP